jgi:hypothetical protein
MTKFGTTPQKRIGLTNTKFQFTWSHVRSPSLLGLSNYFLISSFGLGLACKVALSTQKSPNIVGGCMAWVRSSIWTNLKPFLQKFIQFGRILPLCFEEIIISKAKGNYCGP